MRRLVVTKHDEFIIVYADMFSVENGLGEILEEIYLLEGHNHPMYVFFRGRTLIFTKREKNAVTEIELAGAFSKCQRPDNPIKYNMYRFDPDEEDISLDILQGGSRPQTLAQLYGALDKYFSDLWRISTVFDVVFV